MKKLLQVFTYVSKSNKHVCSDLEQYVESMRRSSTSATVVRPITLKEVEEGAMDLRKVGENLAALKGKINVL